DTGEPEDAIAAAFRLRDKNRRENAPAGFILTSGVSWCGIGETDSEKQAQVRGPTIVRHWVHNDR
ncbi:MAG: hypothetical protein PVH83_12115, partial [Methyloceanibacter sp.]